MSTPLALAAWHGPSGSITGEVCRRALAIMSPLSALLTQGRARRDLILVIATEHDHLGSSGSRVGNFCNVILLCGSRLRGVGVDLCRPGIAEPAADQIGSDGGDVVFVGMVPQLGQTVRFHCRRRIQQRGAVLRHRRRHHVLVLPQPHRCVV